MKYFTLLFSAFLFVTANLYAQVDSLDYDKAISEINSRIEIIQQENKRLVKQIDKIDGHIQSLEEESAEQNGKIVLIETGLAKNSEMISNNAMELNSKIDNTTTDIKSQAGRLRNRTIGGLIIAFVVLAFSALITLLLHKKGSDQIEALKRQSEKINEEIVNKFSTEMTEMQKISASLGAFSVAGASSESERDLIKTLADRITFMEMTLYKMDSGVKGHKQLSRSIIQMKDNLRASGYELVDMLGKPYSDGMKAVASFEDDDTIDEGARIITKVIKPQINYNGIMIQNAQITVSQNI